MTQNISYNLLFEKELQDAIDLFKKQEYINPLLALENYYQINSSDYENISEKAINKCINQRVDFASTLTTTDFIFNNYISFRCPECGCDMNYNYGKFECEYCNIFTQIDLNCIYFNFFEQYWDEIEISKIYINPKNNLEIQIKGYRNNNTKGELLAKITKLISLDNSIEVKIAYEWILNNKHLKKIIEDCISKISLSQDAD